MNTKEVTLATLGQRLNLSRYSVSRALSGKGGVSEKTRRAVLELANELGYQHAAMRPEASGGNIMLLIPEASGGEFWINVISGAEEEAARLGFNLVTRPLNSATVKRTKASWKHQYHGLIGVGQRSRELAEACADLEIPITLIAQPLPCEKFDTVSTLNFDGGYRVGKHVLELGHRRIAYLIDDSLHPTHFERGRGLHHAAHGQDGIEIATWQLSTERLEQDFEHEFSQAVTSGRRPTAIFCALDMIAFSVMLTLQRLGFEVPKDVSIAGFGFAEPLKAIQSVPGLTIIRPPTRHLGIAAVQNLIRQLQSRDDSGPPRHIAIAPELVVRDSTGPAPKLS